MEPDIRMLDKYKSELKDMDKNMSLLQSKLRGIGQYKTTPREGGQIIFVTSTFLFFSHFSRAIMLFFFCFVFSICCTAAPGRTMQAVSNEIADRQDRA